MQRPAIEQLHELFIIDEAKDNVLRNKVRRSQTATIGRGAGTLTKENRWQVGIAGATIPNSHIVFAMTHGRWPLAGLDVDHIDRDSSNDRPSNLREATRKQNIANIARKTKYTGVTWAKPCPPKVRSGAWVAKLAGKYLGRFKTKEEAHAAYIAAKRVSDGEFCPY